jgi:hypothetical protein
MRPPVARSAAFLAAERKRRHHLPVSKQQREHLERLAREAGIEPLEVHSLAAASKAIGDLEKLKRSQPMIEGFSASTGAGR